MYHLVSEADKLCIYQDWDELEPNYPTIDFSEIPNKE